MKKLLKRISVSLLTLSLSLSCFVGCGEDMRNREADQTLEVFIADRGYGTDGVTAALHAFAEQDWVKEKYPNIKIATPVTERTPNYGINKIKSPKNNQFDLIFVIESLSVFFGKNSKGESTLVELTDVMESTVPGENVKVKDKIIPDVMDCMTYIPKGKDEPEYYDFAWCTGMLGMCYNPEIIEKYVEHVPRTTDELIELMRRIRDGETIVPATTDLSIEANRKAHNLANCGNENGYAIGPCGTASYDAYMFSPWWAQYDGTEAYENFWQGIYVDSSGIPSYSEKIFELEGRLEALRVLKEMLKPSSRYYDLALTEKDFMVAQTTLLNGEYAITQCADWFDSEMKDIRETMQERYEAGVPGVKEPAEILVMLTPIISAIVKQLKFRNGGDYMTDEQLSFLVECIDEEKEYNVAKADFAAAFPGTEELKKADYTKLLDARSAYQPGAAGHTACIPSVSNSIDVAKDFVRFFYSDVCQLAYMIATDGQNIPTNFDPNSTEILYGTNVTVAKAYADAFGNFSTLQQPRLNYFFSTFNPVNYLRGSYRRPLPGAGLKSLYTSGDVGKILRSTESQDVDSLFQATIEANDSNKFKFMLFEAGLTGSY